MHATAGKSTLDGLPQYRQQERLVAGQSGSSRIRSRRASITEQQSPMDAGSSKSLSGRPKSSEPASAVGAPRRRRSGFVAFSSFRYQLQQSPSTASTTSLAQLRDKLTVLSPLIFNKVPRKVASSPELPSIKELDERNNLNNLARTLRCGQAKYHSDTEAIRPTKKDRRLSPVKETQSASLVLVAALDNTTQSLKDDIFDDLYKDNPNFDLADLLVAEALQHGQEKDSGVISGKVTQDSDVVENTPVEKNVSHKKLSIKRNVKRVPENKPKSDDSDAEVIDDTPCYVYDRRERVRANSTKAVSSTAPIEYQTLDENTVDDFFSQHVNHNPGNIVISPSLAKKINESISEESDDDCELLNQCYVDDEHVKHVVLEEDIIDCMNSVLDKICDDFDKFVKEQEYQINILPLEQNVGDGSNSDPDVTKLNTNKLKPGKDIYDEAKKVTLKFTRSKKTATKMNTRKKAKKSAKDTNKIENADLLNTTVVSSSRKKRKLYSPKDDEKANNASPTSRTKVEPAQTNVNQTSIATCYRELENVRKSRRISSNSGASTQSKKNTKPRYIMTSESDDEDPSFQIKKRSLSKELTTTLNKPGRLKKPVNYTEYQYFSTSEHESDHNRVIKPRAERKTKTRNRKIERKSRTQAVLSPKTKKMNDMFDEMKENVVSNEKITLVQKKSDFSLYNLSSESEDEDFKRKTIQVQKRVSSSSLESSATKRQRLINRVNYTKYYSSEDEGKRTRKTKNVKQTKPRTNKMKKIPKDNLIDERMRATQEVTLETSFVKETVDADHQPEAEPQLEQAPVLEVITPEKLPDDAREAIELEYNTNLTNKCKEPSKDKSKVKDSAPVSPLPGLLVEKERAQKDDFTSSIEADLLQKFKRIYTDGHNLSETGGTQQLLLNVSDNDNGGFDPTDLIESVLVPDAQSELSIATGGRYPIRAHDDLNESPPNVEQLNEKFKHRDVHIEGINASLSEFLDSMRNQLQYSNIPATAKQPSPVISMTRAKSTKSTRSLLPQRAPSEESIYKLRSVVESNKSNPSVKLRRMSSKEIESNLNAVVTPKSRASSRVASVVLTRISSEEIEQYLTPSRTNKSSVTISPKIVLQRISSDEMNRWLPLPKFKGEERKYDESPKRYKTRRTSLMSTNVTKNIPTNVGKKTQISPVKLNFDIVDLTPNRVTRAVRTRSSTKSVDTRATTRKEPVQMKSLKSVASEDSNANIAEKNQISQETVKSAATKGNPKQEKIEMSTDRSDMSKGVANVRDWLNRNATSNTPTSPSANNNALEEMRCLIMETLQTTLAEINQATGERWTSAFMEDQEDIAVLETEMRVLVEQQAQIVEQSKLQAEAMNRLKEKIQELKKNQRDRACEVIRADAQQKALMMKLLLDDTAQVLRHN